MFEFEKNSVSIHKIWLILLSKIKLCINLFKHTYKILKFCRFQICAYFFSCFSGCSVRSTFVIFHQIRVSKHISEPCSHLAAETVNLFILIENSKLFFFYKSCQSGTKRRLSTVDLLFKEACFSKK
jgi:hypothetical protein